MSNTMERFQTIDMLKLSNILYDEFLDYVAIIGQTNQVVADVLQRIEREAIVEATSPRD